MRYCVESRMQRDWVLKAKLLESIRASNARGRGVLWTCLSRVDSHTISRCVGLSHFIPPPWLATFATFHSFRLSFFHPTMLFPIDSSCIARNFSKLRGFRLSSFVFVSVTLFPIVSIYVKARSGSYANLRSFRCLQDQRNPQTSSWHNPHRRSWRTIWSFLTALVRFRFPNSLIFRTHKSVRWLQLRPKPKLPRS